MKKAVKLVVVSTGNGTKLTNELNGFCFALVDGNAGFSPVAMNSTFIAALLEDNKFVRSRELKAGASLAAVVRCAMLLNECKVKEGIMNDNDYSLSPSLALLIKNTAGERNATNEQAEEVNARKRDLRKAENGIISATRALAVNIGDKVTISGKSANPTFGDCVNFLVEHFYTEVGEESGSLSVTPILDELGRTRAGVADLVHSFASLFATYNNSLEDLKDAQCDLKVAKAEEESACRAFFRIAKTLSAEVSAARTRHNKALALAEDCKERETIIKAAEAELKEAVARLESFKAGEYSGK